MSNGEAQAAHAALAFNVQVEFAWQPSADVHCYWQGARVLCALGAGLGFSIGVHLPCADWGLSRATRQTGQWVTRKAPSPSAMMIALSLKQ